MLRKENAVRVVCPTRTSLPDVIGTEALRKVSAGYCTADVFDEPAHDAKCGIHTTSRPASASPIGRRHVRASRDTMVCIDIQGALAVVPWMLMMAGMLTR